MSENRFEEKDFSDEGFNLGLYKKIAKLIKPQSKLLTLMFIVNTLIAVLDVLFPYLNKIAIDYFVIGNRNDLEIIWFSIFYFVSILVQAGSLYYYFLLAADVEMGFAYDVRKSAFEKLQKLSFSYFDKTPIGWLMARMTSDITRLAEILAWSVMEIAWGVGVMILATIVMFMTDVKLTLLVLVVVPILAYISMWFQIRILKNYRVVRKINSKITSDFNEGISGIKTTKTLVLEDVNFKDFDKDTHEMKEKGVKAATFAAIFKPLITGISSISMALILYVGTKEVLNTSIGLGTLVLFIQYARQFFDPLSQIAGIIAELQMAQASGERVIQLLESEPEIIDTPEVIEKYGTEFDPKPENFEEIKGDIEFKDVTFYYNEEEVILENFNLKVNSGETIALVGETGSGKSTLVNLLCRFYEPVKGQILIDEKDYRTRSIGWLHSNLGYVLQAPHLFSGTIMENVRFGRLDASDEDVYEACKLVNADDFIKKLESGYQTQVGEGGSRLSTGQKQLISFARAILSNPAIFVLDEATSSIDTETEQIIQYAIENIMKNKTSFVVAHRLSTIVNADRILVIKKGKIVESGSHKELMNLNGYYYRLYTNQFNEALQDEIMKNSSAHSIL